MTDKPVLTNAPEHFLLESLKQSIFAMESAVMLKGMQEFIPYIMEAKLAVARATGETLTVPSQLENFNSMIDEVRKAKV